MCRSLTPVFFFTLICRYEDWQRVKAIEAAGSRYYINNNKIKLSFHAKFNLWQKCKARHIKINRHPFKYHQAFSDPYLHFKLMLFDIIEFRFHALHPNKIQFILTFQVLAVQFQVLYSSKNTVYIFVYLKNEPFKVKWDTCPYKCG